MSSTSCVRWNAGPALLPGVALLDMLGKPPCCLLNFPRGQVNALYIPDLYSRESSYMVTSMLEEAVQISCALREALQVEGLTFARAHLCMSPPRPQAKSSRLSASPANLHKRQARLKQTLSHSNAWPSCSCAVASLHLPQYHPALDVIVEVFQRQCCALTTRKEGLQVTKC